VTAIQHGSIMPLFLHLWMTYNCHPHRVWWKRKKISLSYHVSV
jgi:hypothetical protein